MRVVVIGATGNVGSSLLRLLADDSRVESVVGVARRHPQLQLPKTEWAVADIASDDLVELVRGADVVVDLAWLVQPSRDVRALRRVNVEGTARVLDAVARAEVPAFVYASSVAAYATGPKDRLVDESWAIGGVESNAYARHKTEVERRLDDFEQSHPQIRVVRFRPGLIFKRAAASGIRRLFIGPLLPGWVVRPELVPFVPEIARLRFQAVHSDDVAEAYRQAVVRDVRGAFNLAAEPPIDSDSLATLLHARQVRVRPAVARVAVAALWRLRLQPTPASWVDVALSVPLLDSSRARSELDWNPGHSAEQALEELLDGLRDGAGGETPPLGRSTGGPFRLRELASGIGRRGGT